MVTISYLDMLSFLMWDIGAGDGWYSPKKVSEEHNTALKSQWNLQMFHEDSL